PSSRTSPATTWPAARNRLHPAWGSGFSAGSLVATDRVVGQLELVSAPGEQAEGTVALAVVAGRRGHPAAEQLHRRLQLARVAAAGERVGDQVWLHPDRQQLALD